MSKPARKSKVLIFNGAAAAVSALLTVADSFEPFLPPDFYKAALAVVVAHFAYFRILDAAQIARLPDFGREAVIAFFVLSGFVIAYSARHKHGTPAA